MQRLFLLAVLIVIAPQGARAQEFDYSAWQRLLDRYVNDAGRVEYAALKADSADLDRFTAEIAAHSPLSNPADFPTSEAQMAYWINAYNALVMKGVVESWPVKSVLKIGLLPHSFFWSKKFRVGGREMTLDNIEKDELRRQFGDPRIHFALNCASNSCPSLRREAFKAERLDQRLDAAARDFINSTRGMKIDAAANRVTLSRIFKWYSSDFEAFIRREKLKDASSAALAFVRLYSSEQNRKALDALRNPSIEFFEYDWGINDAHAPEQ